MKRMCRSRYSLTILSIIFVLVPGTLSADALNAQRLVEKAEAYTKQADLSNDNGARIDAFTLALQNLEKLVSDYPTDPITQRVIEADLSLGTNWQMIQGGLRQALLKEILAANPDQVKESKLPIGPSLLAWALEHQAFDIAEKAIQFYHYSDESNPKARLALAMAKANHVQQAMNLIPRDLKTLAKIAVLQAYLRGATAGLLAEQRINYIDGYTSGRYNKKNEWELLRITTLSQIAAIARKNRPRTQKDEKAEKTALLLAADTAAGYWNGRGDYHTKLAIALAACGLERHAMVQLEELLDTYSDYRSEYRAAFEKVIISLASNGWIEKARTIAIKTKEILLRVDRLTEIARIQYRQGDATESQQTLALAKQQLTDNSEQNVRINLKMIRAYADLGSLATAKSMISQLSLESVPYNRKSYLYSDISETKIHVIKAIAATDGVKAAVNSAKSFGVGLDDDLKQIIAQISIFNDYDNAIGILDEYPEALLAIAQSLFKSGRWADAQKFAEKAIAACNLNSWPCSGVDINERVGKLLIKIRLEIGDWVGLAGEIQKKFWGDDKIKLLKQLIQKQTENRDFQAALATARSLPRKRDNYLSNSDYILSDAVWDIAIRMVEQEGVETALKFLNEMSSDSTLDSFQLIKLHIAAGSAGRAISLIRALDDEYYLQRLLFYTQILKLL